MFGTIDLARAQVADQQLVLAKNIQRQETVVVVITVEESAFLVSVHGIIGRIKVQD